MKECDAVSKRAVIVDCLRTPIGRAHKEKGVFRDVRSDDLAVAVVARTDRAQRHRSGRNRRRRAGQYPAAARTGLQRRPARGLDGRPAQLGGRHHRQSALRFELAGDQSGRSCDHGRRRRRADRRRTGAHAAHRDGCRPGSEPQTFRPHLQRGAGDGRDRRVSGPDARHFPPSSKTSSPCAATAWPPRPRPMACSAAK